jgi:hypothetical protein
MSGERTRHDRESSNLHKYHKLLHLHSRELYYTFQPVSSSAFHIANALNQPGKDRRRGGDRLGGKGCMG